MKSFHLVIISSPSGAGKTTLTKKLLEDKALGQYRFSVSHTTRQPRIGEKNGVDYYFIDRKMFDAMAAEGKFAENAFVHGNHYGTSLTEVRRLEALGGSGIFFDIDYQGARQIKNRFPDALFIFILPPTIGELRRRLEKRGTETKQSLEIRLRNAIEEIDHHDLFDFVVVNDDLARAYESLRAIIIAHRHMRKFAEPFMEDLVKEGRQM